MRVSVYADGNKFATEGNSYNFYQFIRVNYHIITNSFFAVIKLIQSQIADRQQSDPSCCCLIIDLMYQSWFEGET